ncbi:MAG TPA: rod shape-determining protein MreD [Kiloniellales bacterium]|nr:rod shape-determining protein MreD [Kiloniellales bacterium]
MRQSLLHRIDLWARSLVPFALAVLLVVLSLSPVRLPGFGAIAPWLPLIAVYFWSAHRPDLLPVWAVFLLGVFCDLATGGPLGVSSVTLMLAQVAVKSQRRHLLPQPFIVQWSFFAVFAVLAEVVLLALNALAASTLIDARPAVFQALSTIAAYPLFAWLFSQAQRSLLRVH